MKFKQEIEINKPREKVIAYFDNPENLKKWMKGLISIEPISGEPKQEGAKSLLKFKMGKREMNMTETILVHNLPDEYTLSYEAKGVHNIVKNRFVKLSDNKTKYIVENEFQFKGFMKIIGTFMPGSFKKQSLKYLQGFKNFAEKN
ncbi:SRPBCC family protein [Thermophagus xiamenensis]|uniref:Polyketide cyclase / dehydrase and lipid transport n=1 Tax=Thermophagus xiamenensis TaxID=385682 RepID=A0A1I1VXR9_9BACT|nr:SRPBCC family protein [Thermophagus xiamenensis]SFD86878.1 Polyketide cyclase / dehydrase and lipid transport [Thermophagus xiamenensis]